MPTSPDQREFVLFTPDVATAAAIALPQSRSGIVLKHETLGRCRFISIVPKEEGATHQLIHIIVGGDLKNVPQEMLSIEMKSALRLLGIEEGWT